MKLIGSEFDNFYLLGLKSYLKKYRVSDVENFSEFCLKKHPKKNPLQTLTLSPRIIKGEEKIILLSSKKTLPLSVFLINQREGVFLLNSGALYGKNSDLRSVVSDKNNIITSGEFNSLYESINVSRSCHAHFKTKGFYSQRLSALKKLGISSLNDVFFS